MDAGHPRNRVLIARRSTGDATGRASPQTAALQKVIEIRKCCERHVRCAEVHAGAGRCIEHPGGHHREDAGQNFDMDKLPGPALVDALDPQAPTEKRMPTVVDDNSLPDMGRMNG